MRRQRYSGLKIGDRELARTPFAGVASSQLALLSSGPSGFLDATVVAENAAGIVKELSVVLPVLDTIVYVGERQGRGKSWLACWAQADIITVELSDAEELRAGLDRADLVLLDDQRQIRFRPLVAQLLTQYRMRTWIGDEWWSLIIWQRMA